MFRAPSRDVCPHCDAVDSFIVNEEHETVCTNCCRVQAVGFDDGPGRTVVNDQGKMEQSNDHHGPAQGRHENMGTEIVGNPTLSRVNKYSTGTAAEKNQKRLSRPRAVIRAICEELHRKQFEEPAEELLERYLHENTNITLRKTNQTEALAAAAVIIASRAIAETDGNQKPLSMQSVTTALDRTQKRVTINQVGKEVKDMDIWQKKSTAPSKKRPASVADAPAPKRQQLQGPSSHAALVAAPSHTATQQLGTQLVLAPTQSPRSPNSPSQGLKLQKEPSREALRLLPEDIDFVLDSEPLEAIEALHFDPSYHGMVQGMMGSGSERPFTRQTGTLELKKDGSAPRLSGVVPEDMLEGLILDGLRWKYPVVEVCNTIARRIRHLNLVQGTQPKTVAAIIVMHFAEHCTTVNALTFPQMEEACRRVKGGHLTVSAVTLRKAYKKLKLEAKKGGNDQWGYLKEPAEQYEGPVQ